MAAPPIPVTSPGGPDTPEGPIILPANCAVVTSTFVCLDWQPAAAAPGGGAQVQLPTFAAIKAFVPFCRLSRNPADLAAAGTVNLLCVRLTDAAWSRLFTEMDAAQVFAQNFPTVDALHKATRDAEEASGVLDNIICWASRLERSFQTKQLLFTRRFLSVRVSRLASRLWAWPHASC